VLDGLGLVNDLGADRGLDVGSRDEGGVDLGDGRSHALGLGLGLSVGHDAGLGVGDRDGLGLRGGEGVVNLLGPVNGLRADPDASGGLDRDGGDSLLHGLELSLSLGVVLRDALEVGHGDSVGDGGHLSHRLGLGHRLGHGDGLAITTVALVVDDDGLVAPLSLVLLWRISSLLSSMMWLYSHHIPKTASGNSPCCPSSSRSHSSCSSSHPG
jgi:hypothetical protein